MRGVNHLVLAGHDLERMRSVYAALGFTITPSGQHPFGTGNSIIQLQGCYLEHLAVTIPRGIVEHRPGEFSFSAFNRDYLARHEGFSMLVFDTADAGADIAAWRTAGLRTYAPFEFGRMAKLADGGEVRIGFSLAFVSHPAAPWLGLFACQHYTPEYYAQPRYLRHANGAQTVRDVWITGDGAMELGDYLGRVIGAPGRPAGDALRFQTQTSTVVLAGADAFEAAFGAAPPHPGDGPHLAGFTIACDGPNGLDALDLPRVGDRYVLAPATAFGTALGFVAI